MMKEEMNTHRNSNLQRRAVPWFSLDEWKTVSGYIFSDDSAKLNDGYEHLLAWKARCPNMPAAIECTLGICQILLHDTERHTSCPVPALREQQLQLMYCTGIMRYLNLILDAPDENNTHLATLYQKAAMKNVPVWIVNLRHETAHGSSLPDLTLLRAAAIFILKWLQKYYWDDGNELMSEWVVADEDVAAPASSPIPSPTPTPTPTPAPTPSRQMMRERNNKERKLRCYVLIMEALVQLKFTGSISNNVTEGEIRNILNGKSNEFDFGLIRNVKDDLDDAFRNAEIRMKILLGFRRYLVGVLIPLLLSGESLLLSETILKALNPNMDNELEELTELPSVLEEMWTKTMEVIWSFKGIPLLVTSLISLSADHSETKLRRKMAALWTQKLLLCCIKVREACTLYEVIKKVGKEIPIQLAYEDEEKETHKKDVVSSVVFAAIEKQRPDFKQCYTWTLEPSHQVLCTMTTLRNALQTPSAYLPVFLPCLLELTRPVIRMDLRNRLLELAKVFSGDTVELAETTEERRFCVADLPGIQVQHHDEVLNNGKSTNLDTDNNDVSAFAPNSVWSQGPGHFDWGNCPFGLLPWQKQLEDQSKFWSSFLLPQNWENCSHNSQH